MSTATAHRPPVSSVTRPATFVDALRSEATKLRTLRSARYTLLLAILLGIGTGSLFSFAAGRGYAQLAPTDRIAFDPTAKGVSGFVMAQLAIGVLGVLVLSSEYGSDMISTSLTVVPRRNRLLAAKTLVLAATALVTGEIVGVGSFLSGQAILSAQGAPHATFGDPHVLRAVLGTGLYLAVIGLLGIALGVLVRSTAGALAIIVAATLLVPAFNSALPTSLARPIGMFWPTMAGRQLMVVRPPAHTLASWPGFALMCGAVAVLLALAFVLFHHRDA